MSEEQRTDLVSYCLSSLLALLGLLFIATGQTEASLCSTEITDVVGRYLEVVHSMKTLESTLLYTPNLESYEICPSSTLACFAKEIKVMLFELDHILDLHKSYLHQNLLRRLESFITKKNEEHCIQCELHREAPVKDFLTSLQQILQLLNFMSGKIIMPSDLQDSVGNLLAAFYWPHRTVYASVPVYIWI